MVGRGGKEGSWRGDNESGNDKICSSGVVWIERDRKGEDLILFFQIDIFLDNLSDFVFWDGLVGLGVVVFMGHVSQVE